LKSKVPLLQILSEYKYKDYDKPKIRFDCVMGRASLAKEHTLLKSQTVSTLTPPPGPKRTLSHTLYPEPSKRLFPLIRQFTTPIKHNSKFEGFLPSSPPHFRQFVNGEFHLTLARDPMFQNWRSKPKEGAAAR
jgi:hypothetical protein